MVKSIDDGFTAYLQHLAPLTGENRAANSHRNSVKTCLKTRLEIGGFFHTGSFGNGTAVRRHSDVDFFAVIPRRLIGNNSAKTLSQVRTALKATFPRSRVTVRTPAVLIPFGADRREAIDVVPAVYAMRTEEGYDVFDIPDGTGGWMRSSPRAHKAYVRQLDEAHGGRVKPLVLLLKAWKIHWHVPILSFYLEMRVARYAETVRTIDYARGLERVLESMIGTDRLIALQDPKGISRYIRPCVTEKQEQRALTKARVALSRARDARQKARKGRTEDAFTRWNLFFNKTFPQYR